jgi:hypothetical protein
VVSLGLRSIELASYLYFRDTTVISKSCNIAHVSVRDIGKSWLRVNTEKFFKGKVVPVSKH